MCSIDQTRHSSFLAFNVACWVDELRTVAAGIGTEADLVLFYCDYSVPSSVYRHTLIMVYF